MFKTSPKNANPYLCFQHRHMLLCQNQAIKSKVNGNDPLLFRFGSIASMKIFGSIVLGWLATRRKESENKILKHDVANQSLEFRRELWSFLEEHSILYPQFEHISEVFLFVNSDERSLSNSKMYWHTNRIYYLQIILIFAPSITDD